MTHIEELNEIEQKVLADTEREEEAVRRGIAKAGRAVEVTPFEKEVIAIETGIFMDFAAEENPGVEWARFLTESRLRLKTMVAYHMENTVDDVLYRHEDGVLPILLDQAIAMLTPYVKTKVRPGLFPKGS